VSRLTILFYFTAKPKVIEISQQIKNSVNHMNCHCKSYEWIPKDCLVSSISIKSHQLLFPTNSAFFYC